MTFLCDTNVISQIYRKKPIPRVMGWLETQGELAISVITMHEILLGFRKAGLKHKESIFLNSLQRISVFPVTETESDLAANFRAQEAQKGRVLHTADALIGATAAHRNLILATQNIKDFANCPVRLFNPF